ncbi:MAG: cell division protein FtsQ/DivIB [Alphaproteobacteria bacterium]
MGSQGTRRSTIVKRRQGKLAVIIPWLKRFGVGVGGALLIAWLGVWLWMSGFVNTAAVWSHEEILALSSRAGFRVENIMVENRIRTDAAALMAIINTEKGAPLFSFNPAAAKEQIEKINWVESAQVERRWPNTIYINLQEREPVALWQSHKKLHLIDKEGTVITSEAVESFPDLIIVMGENAPAHIEDLMNGLMADEALHERVASAKWIGDRRWDLNLHNKAVIRLPETEIKAALELLSGMQEKEHILDKDIVSIDLREPGRMSVEPASGNVVNYKNAIDKNPGAGNNI